MVERIRAQPSRLHQPRRRRALAPRRPHRLRHLPDPYLDNQPGVTINGTINLANQGSDLSFGGGYIARNWPSEPYYQQSDGHADYFTGDIAHITFSYPGGP